MARTALRSSFGKPKVAGLSMRFPGFLGSEGGRSRADAWGFS